MLVTRERSGKKREGMNIMVKDIDKKEGRGGGREKNKGGLRILGDSIDVHCFRTFYLQRKR